MVKKNWLFGCIWACLPLVVFSQDYPFYFLENKGQWEHAFQYRADVPGGAVFFEPGGLSWHLADMGDLHAAHHQPALRPGPPIVKGHAFRVRFLQPDGPAIWNGAKPTRHYHNYFLGNDPSQWVSKVYPMQELQANDIWEGVDMRFYGSGQSLKYDFILAPGVSPRQIRLQYEGADRLRLSEGALLVETSMGTIREMPPLAYQLVSPGDTSWVNCAYVLQGDVLSFTFTSRTRADLPVIIDPSLIFGTYSGSTTDNWGFTATYDRFGFLYAGGVANGLGYPTTTGAYQTVWNGGQGFVFPCDLAITKFDTTGGFLIWSTYLGGSGSELPHSIIVNNSDELFVFGTTGSGNFPVTQGAYDVSFNGGNANSTTTMNVDYNQGSDMFISRLSANGTALLASTYMGGTANDGLNAAPPLRFNYADEVRGEILIDNQNNIYVVSVTRSADFPVTPGCFQPTFGGGTQDGVVFKMDNSLTTLIWSSFIGGSGNDAVYAVDLYANNDIVISGGTTSANFPMANSPFNTYQGGNADGFISKISANGANLLHSIFVGSNAYDQVYLVELDQAEDVYVLGQTSAAGTVWIQNAQYNVPSGGQFLRKYNQNFQNIVWSTAFGVGDGNPDISPSAFLVDVCNKIYISGWGGVVNSSFYTGSTTAGLPVTPGAFQTTTDGSDYYLMVIDDTAGSVVYATYYGGGFSAEHVDGGTSRFSRRGEIYQSVCAGCGANSDFPTSPGAWSPTNNAPNCNNGVFKFGFDFPVTLAEFNAPSAVCAPVPVPFTNLSTGATHYLWRFGDGDTSTQVNPTHVYTQSGTFLITLVAFDGTGANCNPIDSIQRTIQVLTNSTDTLAMAGICPGDAIQIGVPPAGNAGLTYTWSPSTHLSDPAASNPVADPPATQMYMLLISNGVCTDTLFQEVVVDVLPIPNPSTRVVCEGETVTLGLPNAPPLSVIQWSPVTGLQNPSLAQTTVTANADVIYKLVYGNGACRDSALYTLQVVPGSTTNLPERFVCVGDTIALNGIDTTGRTHFLWTPSTGLSATNIPFPLASPTTNTTYTLFMDNGQCVDTVIVPVLVLNPAAMAGPDQVICLGGSVMLGGSLPPAAFDVTWTPSLGLSSTVVPNPTASPATTTSYVVNIHLVNAPGQCERADTVMVVVEEQLPQPGFSWLATPSCSGMRLTLTNEAVNDGGSIWVLNGDTVGTTIPQIIVPFEDSVVITQVVINGPCSATLTQIYTAGTFTDSFQFTMPNVFTPYISPGVNDTYCPVGFGNEYCYDLVIYNRWGVSVFESSSVNKCWAGNIKGTDEKATEGVYQYVIKTPDGKSSAGFLHLFRTE